MQSPIHVGWPAASQHAIATPIDVPPDRRNSPVGRFACCCLRCERCFRCERCQKAEVEPRCRFASFRDRNPANLPGQQSKLFLSLLPDEPATDLEIRNLDSRLDYLRDPAVHDVLFLLGGVPDSRQIHGLLFLQGSPATPVSINQSLLNRLGLWAEFRLAEF